MMNQIQYVINGQKYIMLDLIGNNANKDKLNKAIMKYQVIVQGTDVIEVGQFLFRERMAKLKLLVPEENLISFNAES